MAAAFVIFGLSLTFQARRWGATPAYRLLLQIFPAQTWGALFLASGAIMGLSFWQFRRRWLLVTALTAAFIITNGWTLAFVVRYLTSPNTTPETWVSWLVFDYLLLRVSLALDFTGQHRPQEAHAAAFRQAVDEVMLTTAASQRKLVLLSLDESQQAARDSVGSACFAYSQALANDTTPAE
jgi:hypothetical protein